MEITLDVFSGRPNPTWILSDEQARALIDRTAGRALAAADSGPGLLGFRGFVVSANSDDTAERAGLPSSFRLDVTAPERLVATEGLAARALTAEESADACTWLLSTASGAVEDEVLDYIREAIGARRAAPGAAVEGGGEESSTAAGSGLPPGALAGCTIANPVYNPTFWNVPNVQPYNNCYNYAMNYRSDTFAQPGRISGHPFTSCECTDVAAAANSDGCTASCSGSNKYVALVMWPGTDFHWYRSDPYGYWSHKAGSTPATNSDNSGSLITDPSHCDRGPYTDFCGWRYSPTGMHVK